MSRKYAANTKVPIGRSKVEIEKELSRFGADGFMCGWQGQGHIISFRFKSRVYQFCVPQYENEQETKVHFRALCLYIKSMLVWVADGYMEFEEVFLPHALTASGQRVVDVVVPQLDNGQDVKLLPM